MSKKGPDPLTNPTAVLEMIYGLLWHVANNTRHVDGVAISNARRTALRYIDRASQERGIMRARAVLKEQAGLTDDQVRRRLQALTFAPEMPGIAKSVDEIERR